MIYVFVMKPERWFVSINTRSDGHQQSMSSKHFRKRRKKPRRYLPLSPATIMKSITAFICMFILVLLSNQAWGQLASESTRSRVNQYSNHESSTSILPPLPHFGHQQVTRTHTQRPRHDSYLLPSNKLDENQEKRDRLLRKLSSTMLLETLFRKPSTTSNINTRQLPPIFLPHFSTLRPHRTIPGPTTNIRRSDVLQDERSASVMDVATTNLTQSISAAEHEPDNEDAKVNTTSDSFNQRSLNYLVDKLLSLSGPNQGEIGSAIPKNRPPIRAKLPVHQEHTLRLPYLDIDLSSSKAPALTLDMLIKDEYDSRVQPMIESLKNQQNLSIATSTTKADPPNHRLDDVISGSEASTTTSLLQQSTIPSQDSIPLSMPATRDKNSPTNATDDSESDEYEDATDDDKTSTSSTDEDEESEDRPKESTPMPKKILRNVPPYQLGSFTGRPVISTNTQPDSIMDNLQVHTTTTANTVSNDSLDLRTPSQRNGSAADKSFEASTRGSLVFSDGANEAERSNRRKEQSINQGPRRNDTNKSVITTKNDKLGESFLLSQLFSTMNPLIDLNMKLNDQSVNIRDTNYHRNNHPLIYKGYVGKDDYLLSTTSSDWSRPIGNSRENSTTNPYRHLYPSLYSTTTTTPVPPTEPPTVPYNYYLNQPVTNAQSVPPISTPTTESTIDLTPIMPTAAPTVRPRLQPTTRSPIILNFEHPSTVSDDDSQTRVPNIRFPSNRKYSYQIPSNKQQSSVKPQISEQLPASNTRVQASRNVTSESELPENKSNSRPSQSGAKSRNSSAVDSSWSPTKVTQFETTTIMPPATQEIQRKHQTSRKNHTNITIVGGANSSSPMMFTVVETKGRPSSVVNQEITDSAMNSESDDGGATPAEISNELGGRNTSDNDTSDGFSHAKSKFNAHRNKVRVSSGGNPDRTSDQSSDEQDYRSTRTQTNTDRKTRRPTANHHQQQRQPDDHHELKDENSRDHPHVSYKPKSSKKTGRPKNRIQSMDDDDSDIPNSSPGSEISHQQVKKANKFINHEPAGSEVSESGLDHRLSSANQTDGVVHFHQPSRTTESIMVGGSSASDTSGQPVDSLKIPADGAGSAVHLNPNFYGEASSERPVMDNSFSMFGGPVAPHRNNHYHHVDHTARDPYQKTSSNTVLSTVQHPGSTTLAPSTSSNMPPSTSTTQISTTNKESSDESGTRQAGDGAKAANKSSDRLAFILIGGSCVLSVVCLVLAAMSMRCQDMCDDYQSLRNAEKAALKLQKHRLKYTKKHQINRLNHGLSSSDSGQNLIDDFNNDSNRINNTSSADGDLNQARNLRFQTNAKSIQFMDNALGKGQPNWNQAVSNGGAQSASMVNGNNHHVHRMDADGVHQICGCENCTERRMLLHEDLVLSNKHLSWLHPYYQMQHPTRFRPLFGAGSSVSTFFPQMHGERSFRGAGTGGAQVLLDVNNNGVGAHRSCGMARSKSFLSRGNNVAKHAKNSHLDHSACGATHLDCSNLDHNHAHHHVCHNNHHEHSTHKCHHATGETTASDDSELTLDEGHCENHAHCAREQARDELNSRVKLIQMSKLNSQLSSGYRKQLASQVKRTSHSHHNNHSHHHHHHHHNQHLTASSSDSSSLPQCTCTRDHQPLMAHVGRQHKSSHKHHDPRSSAKQQARRDKSMLIWSTNRDRLI